MFLKKLPTDFDHAIKQETLLEPNTWKRSRVALYKQRYSTENRSDKVGVIEIPDTYTICTEDIELITNALNQCTGLGIGAQGKVFLVHLGNGNIMLSNQIVNSIKNRFDVSQLQLENIKIKIWIGSWSGSWPEKKSSMEIALNVLFKLNLLDRVVRELQEFIKNLLNSYEEVNSKVDKFLKIKTIKNEGEIPNIVKIIQLFKREFREKSNFIFEQIDGYASTNHLVNLPPLQHTKNLKM